MQENPARKQPPPINLPSSDQAPAPSQPPRPAQAGVSPNSPPPSSESVVPASPAPPPMAPSAPPASARGLVLPTGGVSRPPQKTAYQQSSRIPWRPRQKRSYLDRGEIRTMQKDITQVKEQEAERERERITQLKAKQDSEKEQEMVRRIRDAAKQTKNKQEAQKAQELNRLRDSLLPPGEEDRVRDLPRPPSQGKRTFMRVAIVAVVAFVVANAALFGYWYFSRDRGISFQLPDIQIPFLSPQESPQPAPPQPAAPAPPSPDPSLPPDASEKPLELLAVSHTSTLQFATPSSMRNSLAEFLAVDRQNGFTKLLFREKTGQATVTNAQEFFAFAEAEMPSSVADHLDADTTFFAYAYERGNRFGLMVNVASPEAAAAALSDWEPRAEQSLRPLSSFWGTPGTGYTSEFRSARHDDTEIRFQTFSTSDVGIVYAFVDEYLILASSFEAVKASIDQVKAAVARAEAGALVAPASFSPGDPPPHLSLDVAIGQVLMIGFPDSTLTPELEDLMKRLRPGGVLLLSPNIKNESQLKSLTEDLQRVSIEHSSLPLFIAVDQEGGDISRVEFGKEKTAQYTIADVEQAYTVGKQRGEELKSLGINLNLSPVLDSTSSTDFLFHRTFQAGRLEAGELAKSLLDGQREAGILSSLKHFPGYGGITFNPERRLATVPDFPDVSPFVFALPADPEFLLVSNVVYSNFDPRHPFSFSPKAQSLIRSDFGFSGVILTDDLSQPSLLENYPFETIPAAPLKAGVDMVMFSEKSYAIDAAEALERLAKTDDELRGRITISAGRILDLKKQFFYPDTAPAEYEHLSQK